MVWAMLACVENMKKMVGTMVMEFEKYKDKFKEALEFEEIHGMEGLEIDLEAWEFFVTWEMIM